MSGGPEGFASDTAVGFQREPLVRHPGSPVLGIRRMYRWAGSMKAWRDCDGGRAPLGSNTTPGGVASVDFRKGALCSQECVLRPTCGGGLC